MGVPLHFKLVALLLWLNAAGFGLPCLQAIGNLLAGRDIPYISVVTIKCTEKADLVLTSLTTAF